MSNIYVGRNASNFKKSPSVTVDRVVVSTGSGSAYYSPSGLTDEQWYAMTGKIVNVTIPFGTQTIADNIRTTLSAKAFVPYSATCAELDPAAELGDWATIGGAYSVIAKRTFYMDSMGTSDFSANTENEVTDKYPYISSIDGATERQIAEISTRLTVAEGEIDLRVEKSGVISAINQSAEAITISANKINLTGYVTATDLSTSGRTTINGANITTGTISANRLDLSDCLTATDVGSSGSTVISGDRISTGSVNASYLHLGGLMDIYSYSGSGYSEGTLGYGTVSVGSVTRTSVNLTSNSNSIAIGTDGYNQGLYLVSYYSVQFAANPCPTSDAGFSCGLSSLRWSSIYSASSSITTSDRNEKNSINYNLDGYDTFFDNIRPVSYKYNNGTSNRTHIGMISQDIEQDLINSNMTSLDFGGFCKDIKQDVIYGDDGSIEYRDRVGEYTYSLRYEEFIGLCIDQIQKLKARVTQLETNAN